jgi:hypothetical protein
MTDKQLLDQLLDACDMSDEEGVGHISTRYIRTLLGAAPVQEEDLYDLAVKADNGGQP